ncbi:Lrp/AsnC family transcriptional regulator [Emcibacter nanhaiensis]|uniref:Lrp/AsnC family transcriptional regulator n=1 Tax=Emcibacter nanhaiensis TaxID=1505037 RepID=A0A501PGM5_9PROT|nr:Lrp/AsnC family transcriptional regulator [Emcibacter nanhaiensis]TPD59131.1 Lrp/AsnC family transcriptional regulator [Emcibacter nanhaiensis]
MDKTDEKLLELLRLDSREPTASLARKLGLSRSTVQDRINRLVEKKIISGFTIRYHDEYRQQQITAHVMVCINQRHATGAIAQMKKMARIRALYVVSGSYDMIAVIKAPTMAEIDETLDDINAIDGVEKTTTSLVLSTKIDR